MVNLSRTKIVPLVCQICCKIPIPMLFIALGFLQNCSTPSVPNALDEPPEVRPNLVSKLGIVKEIFEDSKIKIYGEPISPYIVDKYNHLKAYQGHILIGDNGAQLVLSGIYPDSQNQTWRPVILAFFYFSQGIWRNLTVLAPIEILITRAGRAYYPTGLRIVPSRARILVEYNYGRGSKDAKSDFIVGFSYVKKFNIFKMYIREKVNTHNKSSKTRLLVRVNYLNGKTLSKVDKDSHHIARNQPQILTRYLGNDVGTIVGTGRFYIDESEDNHIFFSPTKEAYNKALKIDLDFYIGVKAQAKIPYYLASSRECFNMKRAKRIKVNKEYNDCNSKDMPRNLALIAPQEDQTYSNYPRPMIIENINKFGDKFYLPVLPGKTYKVQLGANTNYRVTELGPIKSSKLYLTSGFNKGGEKHILGTRLTGSAKIYLDNTLTPITDEYRIIQIRNLADPVGLSVANSTPLLNKVEYSISPYDFLVKNWPVSLRLPYGRYQLTIFNPRSNEGLCCQLLLAISSQRPHQYICPGKVNTKGAGNLLEDEVVLMDFATDLKEKQVKALAPALSAANNHGEIRSAFIEKWQFYIYAISDFDRNLSLKVFTLNANLSNLWKAKEANNASDIFYEFAKFARENAADSFLEMSCPDFNTNLYDYKKLIAKLSVDAVQLWGCRSVGLQQKLIVMIRELSKNRVSKPILITNASLLDQGSYASFYGPKIAFEEPHLDQKGWRIIDLLRKGRYSLWSGSAIHFVRFVDPIRESKNKWSRIEVVVKLFNPEIELGAIRVINEEGEQEVVKLLPSKKKGSLKIPVSSVFLNNSKFIRLELRGKSRIGLLPRGVVLRGNPVILGSTNFIGVN